MNKNLSFILILFTLFTYKVNAQTIISKQLDSLIQKLVKKTEPGIAVGIFRQGEFKYAKGFGLADLNTKRKNSIHTPFNIASMGKQFTAACIYLLEADGKLNVNDKLSKYFPDFPKYAAPITIADLIHHQSGIKDYITLMWLKNFDENNVYGPNEAYKILVNQKSLNFKPGEKYSYSNSGYFLLSLIVERVSGQNLQEFAKQHLFIPLGMKHTTFSGTHNIVNKAIGYFYNTSGYQKFESKDATIGEGNMYTTIVDFQKWFQEFKNHKLLGAKIWVKMLQSAKTSDGKDTHYGGGLLINNQKGKLVFIHGGYLHGYQSLMQYFPKEDLGIVVFSNNDQLDVNSIYKSIYDRIYNIEKQKVDKVEEKIISPHISDEQVKIDTNRYLGNYGLLSDTTLSFQLLKKDHQIWVRHNWDEQLYQIKQKKDSIFYAVVNPEALFIFKNFNRGSSNNQIDTVVISQNGALIAGKKIQKVNKININQYVGEYFNAEIEASYTLFNDSGTLKLKVADKVIKLIHLAGKDMFFIKEFELPFIFQRSENNRVISFRIEHDRVNTLEFLKK